MGDMHPSWPKLIAKGESKNQGLVRLLVWYDRSKLTRHIRCAMKQLDTAFEVVERISSTHAVVILDTAKHGRVVFKGRNGNYPYLTFVARERMQSRISKLRTFLQQLLNLGAENKSQELEIKVQLALNAKGVISAPSFLHMTKTSNGMFANGSKGAT